MGLWTALKETAKGNFRDAGDYLFMSEDSIQTKRQVDNAQQRLIAEREAAGLVSAEKASEWTTEIQLNAFPQLLREQGSPLQTFVDDIKANSQKTANAIGSNVGGILGGIAKAIPFWLWVLLLVGGLFYFAPVLRGLSRVRMK